MRRIRSGIVMDTKVDTLVHQSQVYCGGHSFVEISIYVTNEGYFYETKKKIYGHKTYGKVGFMVLTTEEAKHAIECLGDWIEMGLDWDTIFTRGQGWKKVIEDWEVEE